MSEGIIAIAKVLQNLFNERADELAKQTGFICRERKLTGSKFVKTLLFGWLQKDTPTVEGLVRAGVSYDLRISAQGIDQRFTLKAAEFLKSLLEEAMKQVVVAQRPVALERLNRFSAVYLSDCSVVCLPDECHEQWRGTGGSDNTSRAALKIDTCLELKTGQLRCGLLQGKQHDSKSPLANAQYETGCLRLQDLGYFNLERMKTQTERGEYWLSASQDSLALCEWKLLVTNADSELLAFDDCFLFYGVRWQIELLFKLWKSQGKLGSSVSQNPWRILCELYAKLLALIVQHWLLLIGCWHMPERSLVKATQMIREQSTRLAACFNDLQALGVVLYDLSQRFKSLILISNSFTAMPFP